MVNEKKNEPSSDSHEHDNDHPASSGEFVVPEPDGVQSGIPFQGQDAVSPEPGASEPPASQEGVTVSKVRDGDRYVIRGMSVKTKIIGALSVLTGVIFLIGVVSIQGLLQVTDISEAVANRFSDLAHSTETIKETVHKIRDSEKDYLLLEDQQAIERVNRHIAKARIQLEEAQSLGRQVTEYSGDDFTADFRNISEGFDEYESRFAAQVKDVATARKLIEDDKAVSRNHHDQIDEALESAQSRARELAVDYWLEVQNAPTTENVRFGLVLERIELDLMEARWHTLRFYAYNERADLEEANDHATEIVDLLDETRRETEDRRLLTRINELKNDLFSYISLLKEGGKDLDTLERHQAEVDSRIKAQKSEMKRIGDRVLSATDQLASHGWESIDHESRTLHKVAETSRLVLIAVVVIGLIIGIAVLVMLPKPIVNAINQLLNATQQVANGELRTPIQVDSNDELGALADSFNHMRENLLRLVQRIQRASIQLSSSVNEIQAASNEQASSANQQASAINQLSSSLNEISQSASALVSSSEGVAHNISQVAQVVDESNHKSEQALSSMGSIGSSTKQTSDRIKALNDKMDNINEAVNTISLVADQTTLLSLNAAIEANKAGEMGKGFSVVATEIRRLSDRSIDSAGSISTMVRDIQRATESSAVAMDKSSEEIRNGINMVQSAADTVSTIAGSMDRMRGQTDAMLDSVRAQADSSRMVQSTSTELLASSNMVAKAASQTAAISYELNAMATQLANAVAVFKA